VSKRSTQIVDTGVMTSVMTDVIITKQDMGLISIEDGQEIVYAESNGHVTDDVTRPYDVIVVT